MNNKTTWAAIGSALMSLLAVIAALPYTMGEAALIIPSEYKQTVAISAAIAAAILKVVQGAVSADAKPTLPKE